MSQHPTLPVQGNEDLYERYPHQGDCTGTKCTACGCCCHCADDGHCEGQPGCWEQDCGCPDTPTPTATPVVDVPTGGLL